MSTKIKQNTSENHHDELIKRIVKKIKKADRIVIGAGAGLSASAGLNYSDKEIFKNLYSPFFKQGYETIVDGISKHWYLTKDNATSYWGFWANHINNVYYKQGQLETYKLVADLFKNKEYFIITTNADGQFFKGDFDENKIFSMQGSYGKFQCQKGCHNTLYDNEIMINKMLDGFDDNSLSIRKEDIPLCPVCNELLCPNLRIDHYFVESDSMKNRDAYINFLNDNDDNILLFELGVGFNTPSIIRYPFEEMAKGYDNISLIRVNKSISSYDTKENNDIIVIDEDINELLIMLKDY